MRHQAATKAFSRSLIRSSISESQVQRTPFVCASCQAVLRQRPHTSSKPTRRNLTTSSRQFRPDQQPRQTPQQSSTRSQQENQQPQQQQQQPPTHYSFFPQTFPSGPPPHTPFTPNLRALRSEYLQLQAKAHPDLAPQDQKRQAEAQSMRINEAYKTLQDPLRRAQYLLAQRGIDVEDETAKLSEDPLLMEVLEAREAVDEVESEEELVELREENDARVEASVQVLESAFADGDLHRAAQEAIRLRYWMNIGESIQGWEKGKGGANIIH